jgi:methylmalonyl-CoA mutase N-terminal domain/subunit
MPKRRTPSVKRGNGNGSGSGSGSGSGKRAQVHQLKPKAKAKAKSGAKSKAASARAKPTGKAVYEASALKQLAEGVERWKQQDLQKILEKMPLRQKQFVSDAGIPIPDVLTAADRAHETHEQLGLPGQFPYTRGVLPTMYRGRFWTMRQFAGFGTPEDTNKRFKYLLSQGMMGLSTAFDMPALMGYDCDHPMALGEVGKEGVAISSLKDMEVLFDGIPLDKVTTSMTINATAIVALAMYVAVAEKQGVSKEKLGGTIQADILKEYIAQKEWVVGPRPAVRILIDLIEYSVKHLPKWYPVSVSGYHIREAGATAVQELAFTLSDGFGYVEECVARGMSVDEFAPKFSFFWDIHNDFFEEIAKLRAGRRIWARVMRDKYGAKDPRSMTLKAHSQTAGVSLTAQQPYNNLVRTALQALAAVLGGTQSLHTNSLDETYALPTEEAVTLALRTQQLIAYESGVTRVVDPLAGSYFVEYMTDEIERRAMEYIQRIWDMGGILRAVEEGYPQKEIAESAFQFQQQIERKERIIVGVNDFKTESAPIPLLKIDEVVAHQQMERLRQVKASRNQTEVKERLGQVEIACRDGTNLFEPVLAAVKSYATLGEISDVFRKVWGAYRETGTF